MPFCMQNIAKFKGQTALQRGVAGVPLMTGSQTGNNENELRLTV